MADTCVKSIRVNIDEWNEARAVCDGIHLPMTTAINLFIRQIVLRRGIPIELSLYNEENASMVLDKEEFVRLTDHYESSEGQKLETDSLQDNSVFDEESGDVVLEETREVFEDDEILAKEVKPFDPVRHEQFKNFVENSERKIVRQEEPVKVDDFSDIFGGVFS